MAQGRVQTLRSTIKGQRPTANSRQPGELYVNFADRQLGFIDAAQATKDLVAIRYFSATADYAIGDYVIQGNELYQAKVAVTAGSFNAGQWDSVINSAELTAALGTTTGNLSGQIGIKNWVQTDAYAAGDLVVNNDLIYQAKNSIGAGSAWNLTLWNDFTAVQGTADNVTLPSRPRTGMLAYNQATGKLAYLTSAAAKSNASGAKTVVSASAPGGSTLDPGDFWWNSSQGSMSLWDGSAFKAVGGGVQVYDTIPPNTSQGALWWESDTGNLYVSFDDGNTTQWVQVNAAQGSPNSIFDSNADMYAGFATSGNRFIVNDKADGTGTNVMSVTETGVLNTASSIVSGAGLTSTNGNFAAGGVVALLYTTGAGTIYLRPNGVGASTGQTIIGPNDLQQNGNIYALGGGFVGSAAAAILAAQASGGACYLRPNGVASGTGQAIISNTGVLTAASTISGQGYQCKQGTSGGLGANVFNFFYNAGVMQMWADATNLGNVSVTSDYRTKKDIVDLASQWETVKALRPISYTQAEFSPPSHLEHIAGFEAKDAEDIPGPLFVADDIERWGFLAHELQETLVPSAASCEKDAEDAIQSPNPWTVIAALTSALQEAMARIEALETGGARYDGLPRLSGKRSAVQGPFRPDLYLQRFRLAAVAGHDRLGRHHRRQSASSPGSGPTLLGERHRK